MTVWVLKGHKSFLLVVLFKTWYPFGTEVFTLLLFSSLPRFHDQKFEEDRFKKSPED
jgi:hypothetical protein